MAHTKKLGFILLLISITCFLGCDSDSDDGNAEVLVSGYASAAEPIEGATVSLYTPDGQLIDQFTDETRKKGTFIVPVQQDKIRDGYRIEVTGGKFAESGVPNTDALRAVGFTDGYYEDIIHVGFVSTLLAGYLDRQPEIGIKEAERAVCRFLEVTPTQNLQIKLLFRKTEFSETAFAKEASINGGVDFFMATLLDEMENDDQSTHSFKPPHVVRSFESEVMKEFVKGLVKGAGSEVGGDAAGWVMDSILSTEGPIDQDVLNEIRAVGDQVRELKEELAGYVQAMEGMIKTNEYIGIVDNIQSETGWLDALLHRYIFVCQSTDDDQWQKNATDFKKDLDDLRLETFLNNARKAMIGDPFSAIGVWGDLQISSAVNERRDTQVFTQFQKWVYYQALALNLLMEKLHLEGRDDYAQSCVDEYVEGMKKQADIFLKSVEGMMLLTHAPDPFWSYTEPYEEEWGVNVDYYLQPLPDVDRHEPETFARADEIVGNAIGADRAFTIRLACFYYIGFDRVPKVSYIEDVPMTIRWLGPGTERQPDMVSDVMRFDQQRNISRITEKVVWDLKRYVFIVPNETAWTYACILNNINDDFSYPYKNTEPYIRWDRGGATPLLQKEYREEKMKTPEDEYHNIFVHAWCGFENRSYWDDANY